jgi:hypothetical protein
MPASLIFEIFFKFQEQVKGSRINERLQMSDIRRCGALPATLQFDRTGRSSMPRHDPEQGVEQLAPALSLGRMSKVRFFGLDIVDWFVLLGGSTLIGLMTLLV